MSAAPEVTSGFVAENKDAIKSFRDGKNGMLDLDDGLQIIRLYMAAYKAAEDSQAVDFADVDLEGYVPPPARR